MATIEVWVKDGPRFEVTLDRVPVAGDYLFRGTLARILAVVFTPGTRRDAVAFVLKDPDGTPDEISGGAFN